MYFANAGVPFLCPIRELSFLSMQQANILGLLRTNHQENKVCNVQSLQIGVRFKLLKGKFTNFCPHLFAGNCFRVEFNK